MGNTLGAFVFVIIGWLWMHIRYRNKDVREQILKDHEGSYDWIGSDLILKPILVLVIILLIAVILFVSVDLVKVVFAKIISM